MPDPRFAQLIEEAEEALDAGDGEAALRITERMLRDAPDDIDALDLRAMAHRALGDLQEAVDAYERLKSLEPQNPAWVLAEADLLIRDAEDDRELIEQGLELLDGGERLFRRDEELTLEAELLRASGLNQLGDFADSLVHVTNALRIEPQHPEARLEQGQALFELGRFDEARRVFEGLAKDFPDEAWSHHYLGLLAERAGLDPESFFSKARALAPEDFPAAVHLSPAEFDQTVEEAIARLPEHARPHLSNCVIDVQPIPSIEELREGVSPLVLGLFRGAAIDERSPVSAADHETTRITLYQNNLERFARSRDELIEEIRITVLHEVGHLLGLDEDELYERGLD